MVASSRLNVKDVALDVTAEPPLLAWIQYEEEVVSGWRSRTPHIVARSGVKLSRATRTARQCERRVYLDLHAPGTTWRRRRC